MSALAMEHVRLLTSSVRRLLVTRRDPDTHAYHPLGFLDLGADHYEFRYLLSAADERSLPGLTQRGEVHRSETLFPIFGERVMSARRPDRGVALHALGLDADAGPFEVLKLSGGRRVGDSIELVPVPVADPSGRVVLDFLAHGVRHMTALAQDRITTLHEGDPLRIVRDAENDFDERALLVLDWNSLPLGYVPAPLLDLVHELSSVHAAVLRANPPDVGFHLRLLVRIWGQLPPGEQPFTGTGWETT